MTSKSLDDDKCKVKKEAGGPPPAVDIDQRSVESKNRRRMLCDDPDKTRRWGAESPAETPEDESSRDLVYIGILNRCKYDKSLEHVICKVKKRTANPAVDMDRR
jgi:hypothetical protein